MLMIEKYTPIANTQQRNGEENPNPNNAPHSTVHERQMKPKHKKYLFHSFNPFFTSDKEALF